MNNIGKNNQINREGWLEKTLKKIPAGSKILDAGAGELRYKMYCHHLNYTSQDFAQYDGKGDGVGLHTDKWDQTKLDIVSDITSIPEKDGSFDAIMCIEVIEHIPDPAKAIKEMARLLKKGGKLIVTSPFCSVSHMTPFHFATGFNKYYYEHHFKINNLKIEEITPNGDYYEYLAQEMRRLPWVVNEYSNYSKSNLSFLTKTVYSILSYIYRKFILKYTLFILKKYKSIDSGSKNFCNFGYLTVAEKK